MVGSARKGHREMLIVQNEYTPGGIQNALFDLMREGIEQLRICSAYISSAGSELLFDGVRRSAGNHERIAKTIVTSLDFGLTEPEALRFWSAQRNCTVLVSGTSQLARGRLTPASAFHTKYYLFDRPDGTHGSLVSSANLTSRGLTINSEIGWIETELSNPELIDAAWQSVCRPALPLTDEILDAYRRLRRRVVAARPVEELEPLPPPPIGPVRGYPAFGDADIEPGDHEMMWIQSRGMQGGAHTQLELPRGAHRFFGARYRGYAYERVDHIAEPVLVAGRRRWADRPLTWHGDNAMERINLPSQAMGGFRYENSLILFRRIARNTFEIRVYPWASDSARAFVEASRQADLVFRVGRNSNRLAGFVPEPATA